MISHERYGIFTVFLLLFFYGGVTGHHRLPMGRILLSGKLKNGYVD